MIVQKDGEELASIPIDTMQGLQIYGNTDLSSGLIRELMWRDIPIVWCSGAGRMYGWCVPSYGPNGEQRVDQHVASHEGRLGLAREFIVAKYTINPFSCDVRNQIIRFYRSYVVLRNKSAMRIVGRMCLGSRGSLRHYISHSLGTSSKWTVKPNGLGLLV